MSRTEITPKMVDDLQATTIPYLWKYRQSGQKLQKIYFLNRQNAQLNYLAEEGNMFHKINVSTQR